MEKTQGQTMSSTSSLGPEAAMDLERLAAITPGVTTQLQDFCSLALETIKVYKPELTRLDAKADGVIRDLSMLDLTVRQILAAHEAAHQAEKRRTDGLEDRMNKLEALVAVLPTWKEDLVAKIDVVGRESRLKTETLTMRAQHLDDQHKYHVQVTRERLDALSQIAKTQAEARQQASDRMDGLERQIRVNDQAASSRLRELEHNSKRHDEEILGNSRKVVEQGVLISVNRIDIDALRDRMNTAEKEISASRGDLLTQADKQELASQSIQLVEKQLKAHDAIHTTTHERITKLERDTRVQELQAVAADYQAFKSEVGEFMHNNEQQYMGLNERLTAMDAKIDRGPPGLWKLTKQVAEQATELAHHKDAIEEAAHQLRLLQMSLQAAREKLDSTRDNAAHLELENRVLADKLAAEVQRLMAYTDSRVGGSAAKYELEAVRKMIEALKRELQEAIASMGLRVKFELLHDEVPQVNTIKAYIQQTEQAMARAQERMAYLEEAVHKETERGKAMEGEWATTRQSLDALILDGDFDIVRMRRELQSAKDLFEELGRLAKNGQILTVYHAEEMVEGKIKGALFDQVLERKLLASKVLQNELGAYVRRHEYESLRRMVAEGRAASHMGVGGGLQQEEQASASAPAPGTGSGPLPPPRAEASPSDSTLMAVYQRLAQVEESLATHTELAASLTTRLDATQRSMAAAALQVETDLPELRQQLRDLVGLVASRDQQPGSQETEQAVRRVVNTTLLPEVLERQVLDSKRMLRYIDNRLAQTPKAQDLQALRTSIAELQAQLPLGGAISKDDPAGKADTQQVTTTATGQGPQHGRTQAAAPEAPGAARPEGGDTELSDSPQFIAQVQALAVRISQLEDRLDMLPTASSTAGPAGPTSSSAAGQAGVTASVEAQVGELRAAVKEMRVALPLLARAYEVEGVKQALEVVRCDLEARIWHHGSGSNSGAGLHVNILLPPPTAPSQPSSSAAPATDAPQQAQAYSSGTGTQSSGETEAATEGSVQASTAPSPQSIGVTGEKAAEVVLLLSQHFARHQAQSLSLGQRLAGLEVQVATVEEQGRALQGQVVQHEARVQLALSGLQGEVVPRLESDLAGLHKSVDEAHGLVALATRLHKSAGSQPGAGEGEQVAADTLLELITSSAPVRDALRQVVHDVVSAGSGAETPPQEASHHQGSHRPGSSSNRLRPSSSTGQRSISSSMTASGRVRSPLGRHTPSSQQPATVIPTSMMPGEGSPELMGRASAQSTILEEDSGGGGIMEDDTEEGGGAEAEAAVLGLLNRQHQGATAGGGSPRSHLKRPTSAAIFRPTSSTSLPARLNTDGAGGSEGPGSPVAPVSPTRAGQQQHQGEFSAPGSPSIQGVPARAIRNSRPSQSARTPRVGSAAPPPPHPGPPGWGEDSVPRHLHTAEHADTELSGVMHDLMHAAHAELKVVKDGPLPGAAGEVHTGARSLREAAISRLRLKPYEVQRHVELLEAIKQELDRLVTTTAVSTVDYLALYVIMMDMRLKLLEDCVDQQRDQIATAYRNLESSFDYLKKLQEAVNTKGSAVALAHVDRAVRRLGKAMLALGYGPEPSKPAGLLYDTPLGTWEFWQPFLSGGLGDEGDVVGLRFGSPPARASSGGVIMGLQAFGQGGGQARQRPSTAGPRLAPLSLAASSAKLVDAFMVVGNPFPPPNFLTTKRNIVAEQEKVERALAEAAQLKQQSSPGVAGGPLGTTVQFVGSGGVGGAGIPILSVVRPAPNKSPLELRSG